MTEHRPIIELQGFEKLYGKVRAVHPLDLQVFSGESFSLIGPNGSGKTTIIRALVGLQAPTSGHVIIDGHDITRNPGHVRQLLSYVPQRVTMPGMLTGREILTLFARLKGVPDSRVEEVLELFALDESADRYTGEYSGGMMQRLGLAAALLKDVPLYILDEPTLNLDTLGIEKLHHFLNNLKNNGTTIFFSSHSLHSASQLADRVAVLVEGRVVKIEDVSAFKDVVIQEMKIHVVLNQTSDEMIEAAVAAGADVTDRNGKQLHFKAPPDRRLEVIRAIEGAGGTIEEFHTETPDWEALVRMHFSAGEEIDE